MQTVKDVDFKGKKALVRVDFNVPISDGKVSDATRIRRALPTIQKILNDGGSVVLMSHLGRPKNGPEDVFSLLQVQSTLAALLSKSVTFVSDCVSGVAKNTVGQMKPGDIVLLENLRFYKEEKAGDEAFARSLADLGADVYVNDAFGTAHRAHASTSVIAQFFQQKCFGLLMADELKNAKHLLEDQSKPFTAILGGAKVSDKIEMIENLLDKAQHIIIGGGMAYTFVKAMGGSIGQSLCEDDKLELASDLLVRAREKGVSIHIPVDSVIADSFSEIAKTQTTESRMIPDTWLGLDIGAQAAKDFVEVIMSSKRILWNGPLGVFEMEPFRHGTLTIGKAVAEATKNGAFSLVGGGDSVAAVNMLKLEDQISYVSTGGGAMLEFFEGKTLPGVAAM